MCIAALLGAYRAQSTDKEELRVCIPYQVIPLNVNVCLDVERFYLVWIVRVGCKFTAKISTQSCLQIEIIIYDLT